MQFIERLNRSCYEITPEVVENNINIIRESKYYIGIAKTYLSNVS